MDDTRGQRAIDEPHAPRRLNRRAALGAAVAGAVGLGGAIGVVRERGSSSTPGRVPVTVWTWQGNAGYKALLDAAASFNASQDEIDVTVVQRLDVITTFQLLLTIRSGLGPDLCVGDRSVLAERDAKGICGDIASYLGEPGATIDLDRDFFPCAVEDVRLGDRVVGIPLETTVRVLAVNRSALTAAGVEVAEWTPAHGPATFARLAQVARSLDRADASGMLERAGFVPTFGQGSAYQYLSSWGARYYDETGCAFTLDTPEARGAAQWVHDAIQRTGGQRMAALLQRGQGVIVAPGTPFLRGEIVFAIVLDQELRAIEQSSAGFELGATFVPVPATGEPSRSWATGNALSMMTGARHPREAFRFMAYMASADVLERYCMAIESLPSRKPLPPAVLDALARPPFVTDSVLPGAVPSSHVPIATQFGDLLAARWLDMASGAVDVAAGLADLDSEANQALSDAGLCF